MDELRRDKDLRLEATGEDGLGSKDCRGTDVG